MYIKLVHCFLFFFAFFKLHAQSSPSSILGLKTWLAADSAVVLSGGTVQQWSDISGNGNHFVSPSSGFNPFKTSSNSLNYKPYINFDGTDKLESVNSFVISDATIIILSTQNSGDGSFGRLIDHGYDIGFWIGNGGANTIGGGFKEVTAPYGNYQSLTINTPCIVTLKRIGATTSYFKNNVPFSTATRTTFSSVTSSNKITLGSNINGGDFGKKNIYEVLIYDRALSNSEMATIYDYLKLKYGQVLNLGSDITGLSLCPLTLTAPAGFTNLLWSSGETSSTISIANSGQYWLQATDSLGFVFKDTIQINYPVIQSPQTTSICTGSSVVWNTNLSSPFTFLWSTGATTPAINISTPGNYWVQVTDSLGCTRNSDTLAFTMDNYANTATLGNDTSLCSGNTIGLKIGAAQTASYLWQNGATTATIPITSSGTYSVQATNINGCIVYDTIVVTVSGTAPTALFVAPNACQQTNVSFTNQSIGVAGDPVVSWSWSFGDGATSILQNPTHSYVNSGNYAVQIDVLSAGGCGASFTDSIKIHKKPVATFGTFGFCSDSTTNFVDMTIFGDTSLAAFAWDFGQPGLGTLNNSNVQNPTRNFPNSGIFPISYSVTDNHGCVDDTLVQLTIFKTPEPSFTVTEVCEGQTMSFLNTSVYDTNSVMSWNFGDGTSSGMLNPMKTYTGIGDRIVQLTVSTPNGCIGTIKTPITVHPFPVASMNIGGKCIGTYVQLSNTSTIVLDSISSVFWVINQNDTISGNTAQFFIPNVNQQQAVIHVTSNFGCKSSQSQFITATQTLNADFTMNSPIVATGTTTVFQNTTVGGNTYNWNFGDGNSSVEMSPSHMYSTALNDSSIAVTLIAESSSGCLDTLIRTINLKSSRLDLEIGNVFYQPDGKFAVIGVELKNKGTVVIQSADLLLSTEKGLQFKETWLGPIQPNEKIIYVFQSKPIYQVSYEDNLQGFYCVDAQTVLPNIDELDLTNNRFCKAIEGKSAILMTVYPNPIIQDMEINLLISEKAEVELGLYDMNGRRIQQIFNNDTFEKGLFNYQISMSNVESGTYFLRMISNGEITLQRIAVVH